MQTKENFANWFIEHDKRVMEAHLKREKHTLKKEMRRLQEERDKMREHQRTLEALIEKQEDFASHIPGAFRGGT